MVGNILWGFIIGNMIASFFNLAVMWSNVKGWHLFAFWALAVAVSIVLMLQAPPMWQ